MNKKVTTGLSSLILAMGMTLFLFSFPCKASQQLTDKKTKVTIEGNRFYINGEPSYKGRTWTASDGRSYAIEGLLMNARLVQGIFDDLEEDTRGQWIYPDTREWDPDRNTREFIDAMAAWREHGLLAFTLNLQGGCPYGYCRAQPWDNSAFAPDGSLREDFMNRLSRIILRADELGMVVILGYFYFGQDDNLINEQAVIRAVENATMWVLEKGFQNVIIEINNECDVRYDHEILKCSRVHELIHLVKNTRLNGRSLYVSTSLGGGRVPPGSIVGASDFILLHGNGVRDPARMEEMIMQVRTMDSYRNVPIVNNEDDQPWRVAGQGWGTDGNNFVSCVKNFTSWGFFDFRPEPEHHDFNEGFQSIPVNWQISSERKLNFFNLLAEITGSPGTPAITADFSAGHGKVRTDLTGEGLGIEKVELIVNNIVIATGSQLPFEYSMDGVPSGEHWVKVRVIYNNNGMRVTIETPYYRSPWWPYGGPSLL
jgi:hypothetical protein